MSWISRLTNVFRGNRLDSDLADELEFHIEARTEDLIRRGMPAAEAESMARRQFGNRLLLRESSHDAKVTGWLESVLRDFRFGFRMLWKDRLITVAAIMSLGLAIGACTGAFSLLDALVLRPLPVHDPARLFYLSYPTFRGPIGEDGFINEALYQRLRPASKDRIELFGYMPGGGPRPVVLEPGGEEERVRANAISGDAFRILGVQPALGRLLTAADDPDIGGRPVAVLSHAFWTRRFGGSPLAIGRTFTSQGTQYQIVGVTEKSFTGLEPGYLTEMWVSRSPDSLRRFSGWTQVWGRLNREVAPLTALAPLQAAFTNFRREYVDDPMRTTVTPDRLESYITTPLRLAPGARGSDSLFRRQFQRPLWILAAVAGLVLLIACSNVANLFLARAEAREREMAMRASIGAGRLRLFQQVLVESAMVALAGCAAGLALANLTAPIIVSLIAPPRFPAYLDLRIDHRVLGVLALIGVVCTLIFGLVPALRASVAAPNRMLQTSIAKQSTRISGLRPLVAAQVGFSFAVLFLAGLLLLTFQRLTTQDVGFAKDGIVLVNIQPQGLKPGPRASAIERQLLDQVRQMPGVQNASLSAFGLLGGPFAPMMARPVRVPGGAQQAVQPVYLPVSPGFFDTMRMRVLVGRDLAARDIEDESSPSVLVNESFARVYFQGQNPVGKTFEQMGPDSHFVPRQIVGLVRDAKYNNLREAPGPTVYEPLRMPFGALEMRTAGDPLAQVSALREAIQHVDPAVRVINVTLQSAQIDSTLLSERLLALLAAFFAVAVLLLAAVGLYGVISYSVARRTKELGIRLALGAQPAGMIRLVIGDMGITIALGLAAGLSGGFVLSRMLDKILFETNPEDASSIVLPLIVLLVTAGVAALPPAIRASRVDPTVALRYE